MAGIQPSIPVGADGLPINWKSETTPGGAGGGAANVNVALSAANSILQLSFDLSKTRVKEPLVLLPLKTIYAFTVRRLNGAGAGSVRLFVGKLPLPIELEEKEVRNDLAVSEFCLTNNSDGGFLQIEFFGS